MKKTNPKAVNKDTFIDESNEYKDKYLRVLADYQNLEKRTVRQLEEFRQKAADKLLLEILSLGDSLENLRNYINDKGVDLVYKQYLDLLERNGLVRINTIGIDFDPEYMECVDVGEGLENKVLAEMQSGYRKDNRLLRPAKVQVGKKI